MAATVQIAERNGVSPGTETPNVSHLNMGSADVANLTPASCPITAMADGHAFEKWVRINLTALGGSTRIDNLKAWLSSLGGGWKTGEGMSCNLRTSGWVNSTYPAGGPINTNSSVADQVMPEVMPGGPNIGIGGSLAGYLSSAPSYSDYVVLQLDVTASTPAGNVNQKTITFQYDEQ
jgi:hypothetical protein